VKQNKEKTKVSRDRPVDMQQPDRSENNDAV